MFCSMALPGIRQARRNDSKSCDYGHCMLCPWPLSDPDRVCCRDRGQEEDTMASEEPATIWTRDFSSLCTANLALFMSAHMITPTLPVYLLHIGGSRRDVGYVMAAYTVGAMVMRPVAGALVDRWGRKKTTVVALLLTVIATTLYRFAGDVPLLTAVRCFHGLAFGMVGTAIGTMVIDILPVGRFSEGIGYFGLTSSFSMAITPMIAFWLIHHYGFPILFLAVVILTMLSLSSSLLVQSRHDHAGDAPEIGLPGPPRSILTGLMEKAALPASGVMFFISVVFGAVMSFIALYAAEQGITNIGPFFTALALVMLVTRPLSGRWADRGGADKILLAAHLAVFFGLVTVGLSHTMGGFILTGALLGTGFGFFIPTLQALAVRYVPVNRRGAATGTYMISIDLGIGLGTILWGHVAETAGYRAMFFANLIPLALAGLIFYLFIHSQRPGRPE